MCSFCWKTLSFSYWTVLSQACQSLFPADLFFYSRSPTLRPIPLLPGLLTAWSASAFQWNYLATVDRPHRCMVSFEWISMRSVSVGWGGGGVQCCCFCWDVERQFVLWACCAWCIYGGYLSLCFGCDTVIVHCCVSWKRPLKAQNLKSLDYFCFPFHISM